MSPVFINNDISLIMTQDLTLARQALYHLSHILGRFCFSYFLDRISRFCSDLASDRDDPTSAS
jgi:hypothetical protein